MSAGPTVLLRRSALGDLVLLGSVTAAIPGPVTVVTDPRYLRLARRLRGVDRVVDWSQSQRALAGAGRVVDLQGSLRSLRLAPGAARIRKRSLARWRSLWRGVGVAPHRPHVPALYGEAVGVTPRPPPWIVLPETSRVALALVPGAAWAPKRWPAARFIALGQRWRGPVVVLGGPQEGPLVDEVCRGVPRAQGVVERGFSATLEALARVQVVVAADTGLMHLAAATGAKVVGLFGPTHPHDGFFPYTGQGEVVQRPLGCRPCALHRVTSCARGDVACMDQPVDEVWAAVMRCAG